jgi:hypothetical protein
MDPRSIQDFRNFVAELSNKLAAADRFFTARLSTRLTKAAQQNEQDQTIVQMANFLSRRANSPGGHLITRAELADVYNRLYTSNTKCAAYLEEELGLKAHNLPEPAQTRRSAREGEAIEDLYSRHADQGLVAQLEAAFDNKAIYKTYDPTVAKKAEKLVLASLPGNPIVQTVDGRDYAILCQATYETPRGKSSVLVPVEVVDKNALIPTVFLTPAGFENLNHKLVEDHVFRTAGKNYRVNSEQIFNIIKKAKAIAAGEPDTDGLDAVDAAVMSFKAKTGGNNITPEGILYQKVDVETKPVQLPESKQTQTFAEQLGSVAGQAEFVFGQKAVGMGRYWVQNGLEALGYSNVQVKVANIKDDSIIYAVSVAGSGFKVPVKVEDKRALPPRMVLTSSGPESFDKEGIMNALGANDISSSSIALGYDLSNPAGLIREIQAACEIGDVVRAGEAFKALAATGDETATKYAFDLYTDVLNGVKKEAKATPRMKTIKIGGNIVEASTGLPVDKVYIDEYGQVQLKSRQYAEKTDQVAAGGFMNAKIIMGM